MSKYLTLSDHLLARKAEPWRTTFSEIERVLGFSLPASARKHQAWWANESEGSHVQSTSWLRVGWRTKDVDMSSEKVTLEPISDFVDRQSTAPEHLNRAERTHQPANVKFEPSNKVEITFAWRSFGMLELDDKNRIAFPKVEREPAVYCFLLKQGSNSECYIGETDIISRRLQHYRTPGVSQRTNQRLNFLITKCLEDGGTVEFKVVSAGDTIQGGKDRELDLSDKFQRRFVECAAIVAAQIDNQTLLNA